MAQNASESARVCASVWCGPCVGNTIGAQRQIVVSRSPLAPPIPLPHHHLLLFTPRQKLRISANSPLVDIHGPHQGKNNNHPSLNIPSAYLFPRYLPANRPQVDWRWGIPHHLKFPYKEILTRHIQAKPPVSNSQPRPLARLLPPYVSVFTCLLVVAVVVIAVVTAMLSPLWSRADG